MSDPDDVDEVFRDLRRFAEKRSEDMPLDPNAFVDVPQIENDDGTGPEDELILGDDYVTYLIYADERQMADFSVSTEEDSIQVKTEDFTVKRALGLRINPEETSTTYTNGVLSVKLRRLGDR